MMKKKKRYRIRPYLTNIWIVEESVYGIFWRKSKATWIPFPYRHLDNSFFNIEEAKEFIKVKKEHEDRREKDARLEVEHKKEPTIYVD